MGCQSNCCGRESCQTLQSLSYCFKSRRLPYQTIQSLLWKDWNHVRSGWLLRRCWPWNFQMRLSTKHFCRWATLYDDLFAFFLPLDYLHPRRNWCLRSNWNLCVAFHHFSLSVHWVPLWHCLASLWWLTARHLDLPAPLASSNSTCVLWQDTQG